MQVGTMARLAVAGSLLGAGLAAAPAAAPTLAAVARIEPGQWQLRPLDGDAPPRALCIADATMLIQYGHADVRCQHFVIANDANLATVHYTCTGTGHGQTSVKVATPRSFNLDTQGVLNGAPFDEHYEARRLGVCLSAAPPAR